MSDLIFGCNVSVSAVSDPVRDARAAERARFDFVSVNDHPAGGGPVREAWTLLSWIAAKTERIAVAPRVLAVPLRLPAVVAKSCETLDRLSSGRVILTLGSGGSPDELAQFGALSGTAGQRTTGLEDAIRIIRGLWSGEAFSYSGDVYRVANLRLDPEPVRRIPIWLGTFGRRGLVLAGSLADGWFPSLGHRPESELPRMRARVVESALAAGKSADDVRCVLNLKVHLGGDVTGDAGALEGEPNRVVDGLNRFVEMGFGGFNIIPEGNDFDAQVAAIGDEVIPAVRSFASARGLVAGRPQLRSIL
jgi:alkanesulfonate monooxygenase SsuD/methylene tetrahydromethanopterin reductase-like flavin-dependent oxidoreductase (luciferase family)